MQDLCLGESKRVSNRVWAQAWRTAGFGQLSAISPKAQRPHAKWRTSTGRLAGPKEALSPRDVYTS